VRDVEAEPEAAMGRRGPARSYRSKMRGRSSGSILCVVTDRQRHLDVVKDTTSSMGLPAVLDGVRQEVRHDLLHPQPVPGTRDLCRH
jgi:hypothetical protein